MTSYEFYTTSYHGDSIPAEHWDAYAERATAQLKRYKRIYTVTAPGADSEDKAICAMADALYFYDEVGSGYASSSIGSVSTSVGNVDLSPKAQSKEVYKSACLYLDIYRGVR